MTQENKDYTYLIGKKMKAFKFYPDIHDCGFVEEMEALALNQEVGVIKRILTTKVLASFPELGTWWYPLEQAIEHLVEEEQVEEIEIPELGEGVLMEVSNFQDFRVVYKRMVYGKLPNDTFVASNTFGGICAWQCARPIQHKEISKEEAEQKLAELTKEKWKIV
jgi:hypothetical protein